MPTVVSTREEFSPVGEDAMEAMPTPDVGPEETGDDIYEIAGAGKMAVRNLIFL